MQEFKHGSGTTTLITSNEEMNDIMEIVQAPKDSNILLKGVTKKIYSETREQKGGFWGMLLGTSGATLSGNILAGMRMLRAGYGNKEGKGVLWADYESSTKQIFWFHPIL